MTNTQFVILLATVWIAPHNHPLVGSLLGSLFLGFAVATGMGWL
jgi:hypothetical protein